MSDNTLFPAEILTPASVELLTQLNRYHAGLTAYDDFVQIMEKRSRGLEQALTQFLPNVPINPRPDAAKVQQGSLNILAAAINDLSTVIPQMLEYAAVNNEEMYKYLLDRLGRIWACERQAIDQYNMANVPEGPTDMPFVNAVYHAQKRFYAGELTEAAYVQVIDKILEKLHAAYDEIEARETYGEPKEELQHAYVAFIEALETVKTYIAEGEDYARSLMRDVTEASQRVRDSIKVYTFHATTSGPTRMIQANLMINMAESWKQGRLEPGVFLRGLEIFADNLDRTWRQLQALAALPNDAAAQIAGYMDTLREAYEEQFHAVELYREAVGGRTDVLDQALAVMTSGADKAADCREAFLAMGENVGKIPCMRCGHYNMPGSRTCEQCGARILGAEAMAEDGTSTISFQEDGGTVRQGGGLVITEPLRVLFETVNAVTEGRMETEALSEAVATYRNFIDRTYSVEDVSRHLLEEANDPHGDLPARVEEVSGELDEALQMIHESLGVLEQYAVARDSQCVLEGLVALKDSSIKLQSVLDKIKGVLKGKDDSAGCDTDNEEMGGLASIGLDFGEAENNGFVG